MLKDYFGLAFGSMRKRFLRTSLTMVGIFIGIAAVVALVSLGQGMRDAINSQFASVGTDKILIQGASPGFGPPGQDAAGKIDEDDLRLIRGVAGINRAAGRLLRPVNIEYGDSSQVIYAASLPEDADDRELVIEANNLKVAYGRLLRPGDKGKIVLGVNLWKKETFTKPIFLGSKLLLSGKTFEVIGLLDKIGAGRDDSVLLNEEDMRDLLGIEKDFSVIAAQVDVGEDPAEVAERVLRTIRRDRHQKEGFEDVTVSTSQDIIGTINIVLGVVQAVFIGIAAISLLVGGIGIMNTMYTSVLERTRDIGVMKAIGAKNSDIFWIFFIESGLLGMAGGVIGIILGVGLSKAVEIIGGSIAGDLLKASFPPELMVGALLFSFVVGALSGVLPARQASRMQPVEALQHE